MSNKRDSERKRIAGYLKAELEEDACLETDAYLKAVLSMALYGDDKAPSRFILAKLSDLLMPEETSMTDVGSDTDSPWLPGGAKILKREKR